VSDTARRRILLVEDEESLAGSIRYSLEQEGFTVTVAVDGRKAIERFRSDDPDLVILDLMLPELSGLDVCRLIRAESTVPIVMVTAKDSEADKVAGLELGADDYVTKPFSIRELVSRVRAHLRRARMQEPAAAEEMINAGPIEMDVGRLLTREFLIEEIWGHDYVGDTKTLDVHVKRIRQKIEHDPHEPELLLTVRGLGYKFVG